MLVFGALVLVLVVMLTRPSLASLAERVRMRWWPRSAPSGGMDAPIVLLSLKDGLTVRDLFEHVLVFGRTGSGKSSGPGRHLAEHLLRAGWSGLVICIKPGDAKTWLSYCRATGRTEDVIHFQPNGSYRLNPLSYSLASGPGGCTENLLSLVINLAAVSKGENPKGSGEDPYWLNATKEMLRSALMPLRLACPNLSLIDLYHMIGSAPQTPDEVTSEAWQQSSFCYRALHTAARLARSDADRLDLETACQYWLSVFPAWDPRPRSGVVSMFTSMASGFLYAPFRELFCTDTNVTPEDVHAGRILLVDFPIKEHEAMGRQASTLIKWLFMKTTERRRTSNPCFIFADEAHLSLVAADDTELSFLTTARSSNVACIYMTQSLGNFKAYLSGNRDGASQVDALVANFKTQIFLSNSSQETNRYAASLFGRLGRMRSTFNAGHGGMRGQDSHSAGGSEHLEDAIHPHEFSALKTGGPLNRGCVEAIVYKGGETWRHSGTNALRTVFLQGA